MVRKIGLAVLIGILVTLGCLLVGSILSSVDIALALLLGKFLVTWSGVLGIVAAIWYALR